MATVDVLLHGRVIGSLVEDARGQWVFRFTDSYRRSSERPTLGQKFEDDLVGSYRGKKGSLPPFFANLVPERDGELRPILEAHLGVSEGDDITLLERLGRDLPGAVEVRWAAERTDEPENTLTRSIDPTEPDDVDGEWLRASLAGVQLKFSVLLADDRITLPAHGRLGDWLVKFASRRFPGLCENEYAMMTWARTAGFVVPDLRLRPASSLVGTLCEHVEPGTNVLAVRRFDRHASGAKIHQEDFAQVVNLLPERKYDHYSYEDIFRLVTAIGGQSAGEEVIRRIGLMIASGNGDAHLKNWSLVYVDRVAAQLSPLYDQVATVAWPKQLTAALALKIGGVKGMAQVDNDVLADFARRSEIEPRRVISVVEDVIARLAAAWSACIGSGEWPLPEEHEVNLREHWKRTPLLRRGPLSRL